MMSRKPLAAVCLTLQKIVLFGCLVTSPICAETFWEKGFQRAGIDGTVSTSLSVGNLTYFAGQIRAAGAKTAGGVVAYDWSTGQWSILPGRFGRRRPFELRTGQINALAMFDDGDGPRLVAAGGFENIDGQPIANIAQWTGQQWEPLGTLNGAINSLSVSNSGNESTLYATSSFSLLDGQSVARRTAGEWQAMGTLPSGGEQRVIYVWKHAGVDRIFVARDEVVTLREWNGSEWIEVGLTIEGGDPEILALGSVDENLLICGDFDTANGEPAEGLVRWDGVEFESLTFEPQLSPGSICEQVAGHDSNIAPGTAQFRLSVPRSGDDFIYQWTPPGPATLVPPPALTSSEGPGVFGISGPLVAGPEGSQGFAVTLLPGTASDTRSPLFAYLNERWSSVAGPVDGLGLSSVGTVALVDINGQTELVVVSGPDQQSLVLQAGRAPRNVARLKNGRWEGVSTPGRVSSAIVRKIQNEVRLYAVLRVLQDDWAIGQWTTEGFIPVDATPFSQSAHIEVAERDGEEVFYYGAVDADSVPTLNIHTVQGWQTLSGFRQYFNVMRAFDAGNGPQLYASGQFDGASGVIEHLARHNGFEWEDTGYPGLAPVFYLDVVPWQGKLQLLVVTNRVSNIWLYDGATWTLLNGPEPAVSFTVSAAQVVDNCLLVGGVSRLAVGAQTDHFIHRYCNEVEGWTQVFDAFNGPITSMATRPDTGDASLWVGGDFSGSGKLASKRIAKGVLFRLFVDSFESGNAAPSPRQ